MSRPILALLVVLSGWAITYELAVTTWHGLLGQAPFNGIWQDVASGTGGLALVAAGFRRERGWALFGLGVLCWASGDVYWQLHLANLSSPPVPSWADLGYLSFCPLAFAGILSLVRGRAREATRPLIADAVAAALATGSVGAAIVVEPVIAHAQGGALAVATNLAYPICDLALLGLLIGALAVGEWRLNRRFLLLGAAVLAFWIADSGYLVSVATGTYNPSQFYIGGWYGSPVLAAWAAWLPARGAAARRRETRGTSARGIVMLLSFALAALTVLVFSSGRDVGTPAIGLSVLALLVIMARLVITWQENVQLLRHSRTEALTDSLTALANRRALMADLEHLVAEATAGAPAALALFDLDGFKHYNDNFGHPAGDKLLQRLGRNLADSVNGRGQAYRMGGDEFCALLQIPAAEVPVAVEGLADALSEVGDGFTIGCSYGSVVIPLDAANSESALRMADQRLYAKKRGHRQAPAAQTVGEARAAAA